MSAILSAREFRPAVAHFAATIGLAMLLAVIAATVDSTGATKALALASLIVMLLGTLTAMVRTYLSWRADGRWQIWQGATWFLLGLSLLWFTSALPVVLFT